MPYFYTYFRKIVENLGYSTASCVQNEPHRRIVTYRPKCTKETLSSFAFRSSMERPKRIKKQNARLRRLRILRRRALIRTPPLKLGKCRRDPPNSFTISQSVRVLLSLLWLAPLSSLLIHAAHLAR